MQVFPPNAPIIPYRISFVPHSGCQISEGRVRWSYLGSWQSVQSSWSVLHSGFSWGFHCDSKGDLLIWNLFSVLHIYSRNIKKTWWVHSEKRWRETNRSRWVSTFENAYAEMNIRNLLFYSHPHLSRETTGMVMHKDSKWYQSWQNFKDNNQVVNSKPQDFGICHLPRLHPSALNILSFLLDLLPSSVYRDINFFSELFDMKMKYDESDHVLVRLTRTFTDKVGDLFGELYSTMLALPGNFRTNLIVNRVKSNLLHRKRNFVVELMLVWRFHLSFIIVSR